GREATVLLPLAAETLRAALREPSDEVTAATTPSRQVLGRRKDGSEFYAEIELRPFETPNGTFVVASIAEIPKRRGVEVAHGPAIDQPRAVELLIADLSSQFIDLPSDQIEQAIRSGLRRICQLL